LTERYRKIVSEKDLIGKTFPSIHSQIKGLKLICRGWIQPSEHSARYKIEIEYVPWNSPDIRILEPEIEINPSTHIYPNGNICLYDWREQPWLKSWHLHETIIPWLAEWLVFYELYILAGKWHGISAFHEGEKTQEPRPIDDRDRQ
jgi:hypothetical protein